MRELPILMNGAMVRAVLEGRKTVTRRVVKPQPLVHHWQMLHGYTGAWRQAHGHWRFEHAIPENHRRDPENWIKPPYQVGDWLYVRETTFRMPHPADAGLTPNDMPRTWQAACEFAGQVLYRADMESRTASLIMSDGERWTPSIHMPKDRARIWLEVTAVRVERLQDITEEQAYAEGVDNHMAAAAVGTSATRGELLPATVHGFAHLWDGLAKPGNRWDDNPWVWVVEFKRVEREPAAP